MHVFREEMCDVFYRAQDVREKVKEVVYQTLCIQTHPTNDVRVVLIVDGVGMHTCRFLRAVVVLRIYPW